MKFVHKYIIHLNEHTFLGYIEKKIWYKRLKFYQNYFDPGHNLKIVLSIQGSIISMDINELSIICEEVWLKQSGFEQRDLFTEGFT